MLQWKLFIDDEREPVTNDWIIARTSREAIRLVRLNGVPNIISFDHDLGEKDTVIAFIYWLRDSIMDKKLTIPDNFTYVIHSQNPVGAQNIKAWMDNIIRHLRD